MNNERPPRRREERRKKSGSGLLIILLILLAAGALALFLYFRTDLFRPSAKAPPSGEVPQAVTPKAVSPAEPASPAPSLPGSGDSEQTAAPREEKSPAAGREESCEQLAEKLHRFFSQLDGQEYLEELGLKEKSEPYFLSLRDKLLANPPIVTRETDNLLSILKNMAHIFRTIGRRNIILIKAILDREQEDIEDIARAFYRVHIREKCDSPQKKSNVLQDNYYDYAGFFLTTIGGRAYLFRRDSKLRLLVNYYSVLIIEDANESRMNKYGIDLQQIIPALIGELESTTRLIYKERYLDRLYRILEKYQR